MALPLRRFCGTLRYRQADKQTPGNSFTEVIMVFFFFLQVVYIQLSIKSVMLATKIVFSR